MVDFIFTLVFLGLEFSNTPCAACPYPNQCELVHLPISTPAPRSSAAAAAHAADVRGEGKDISQCEMGGPREVFLKDVVVVASP